MKLRLAMLSILSATSLLACGGDLLIGGSDDGGTVLPGRDAGPIDDDAGTQPAPIRDDAGEGGTPPDAGPIPQDGGPSPVDAGSDAGGFTLPPECTNPGPFAVPSAASIDTQIVGRWIDCDNSIFTGATATTGLVGIVIRADNTWQNLGASNGAAAPLAGNANQGTWSSYAGGVNVENILLSWNGTSLAVDPMFAPDGRSMRITTAAGGNQATLAKQAGTP